MRRRDERGNATIGTIFWAIVFAAILYASWHVLPVYMAHYNLSDKTNELARTFRGTGADEKVKEGLLKAIRENELDKYIDPKEIKIDSTTTGRRIEYKYDVELEVLPGYKRVFHFEVKADQPII